jgi:hypothetical protein
MRDFGALNRVASLLVRRCYSLNRIRIRPVIRDYIHSSITHVM